MTKAQFETYRDYVQRFHYNRYNNDRLRVSSYDGDVIATTLDNFLRYRLIYSDIAENVVLEIRGNAADFVGLPAIHEFERLIDYDFSAELGLELLLDS